jgi:hypothetical protein
VLERLTSVTRKRQETRPFSIILLERGRFLIRTMRVFLLLAGIAHETPGLAKDPGTVGVEGLEASKTLNLASPALVKN